MKNLLFKKSIFYTDYKKISNTFTNLSQRKLKFNENFKYKTESLNKSAEEDLDCVKNLK